MFNGTFKIPVFIDIKLEMFKNLNKNNGMTVK